MRTATILLALAGLLSFGACCPRKWSEGDHVAKNRIESVTGRIRDVSVPERGDVVIRIEPESAGSGWTAGASVVVCELPTYAPRERFEKALATLKPGMRVEVGGYRAPEPIDGTPGIRPVTFVDIYPDS